MTAVTSTPPALRWVALFLAACAVLGLFLGFRDQIRKNPPDWYTGAERAAAPLPATPDTAREAVAFDPTPPPPVEVAPRPAPKAATPPPDTADTAEADANSPSARPIPPPVLTPTPTPKLKAATPAPKPPPSADPVGDILEGQKQTETPAAVPY